MLQDVEYVATTADCWSAHHRSFLGQTCHWINKKTRAREHAVLACRRLKGSHTYDVLADAMTVVHGKFGIQDKIVRTTTDNGSNFVKAFRQFSQTAASLPALDVPLEDPEQEEDVPETQNLGEEIEEPRFFTVDDLLTLDEPVHAYTLPVHMRCAAHTLNLVATTDADKALQDHSFESATTSAMKKARSLWNGQARSVQTADHIEEELRRRLVIPNSTRWNSIYDSIVVLNSILADDKTK